MLNCSYNKEQVTVGGKGGMSGRTFPPTNPLGANTVQFNKTWGEVFNHHIAKGEDHSSAAYYADQYVKRAEQSGQTVPVRNTNWNR